MRLLKSIVLAIALLPVLVFCGAAKDRCPVEVHEPDLQANWSKLLDLAIQHDEEAKACLGHVAARTPQTALRDLARHLLDEWNLPDHEPLLQRPALIWRPEVGFDDLPAEHRFVSGPGVLIKGNVRPEGTFVDPVLVRSSNNARVDDLCLAAVAKALYRPARDGRGYIESEAFIQIHLDPR